MPSQQFILTIRIPRIASLVYDRKETAALQNKKGSGSEHKPPAFASSLTCITRSSVADSWVVRSLCSRFMIFEFSQPPAIKTITPATAGQPSRAKSWAWSGTQTWGTS